MAMSVGPSGAGIEALNRVFTNGWIDPWTRRLLRVDVLRIKTAKLEKFCYKSVVILFDTVLYVTFEFRSNRLLLSRLLS
jgi:hypothetical protein